MPIRRPLDFLAFLLVPPYSARAGIRRLQVKGEKVEKRPRGTSHGLQLQRVSA